MKKRIVVACLMLAILVGAFALRLIDVYGTYLFDALICILSVVCALEFSKLLNQQNRPASVIASGIFPCLIFAGHTICFALGLNLYLYATIQLSILLASFLITTLVYIFVKTKKQDENDLEQTSRFKFSCRVGLSSFLSFIYPTLFLLALMLLNRIDVLTEITSFEGNFGWVALVLTFLIPVITDTFAMFGGMLFKGPKLCPKVSPKKTISGAVTAVVLTSAVCGASYFLFNLFPFFANGFAELGIQFWHFIILGFLGSIVCQTGDLFESYIKRKAGVKDSSNLIPGHGGFLDRFDSHIFNAPFVLLFFILIVLI